MNVSCNKLDFKTEIQEVLRVTKQRYRNTLKRNMQGQPGDQNNVNGIQQPRPDEENFYSGSGREDSNFAFEDDGDVKKN